ncbi:hypothetical protein KBC79_04665 [Candidatus Woesebacteria bacterium]|nr:hypothetical protein [Candidatus Woesebacteria bacterium]
MTLEFAPPVLPHDKDKVIVKTGQYTHLSTGQQEMLAAIGVLDQSRSNPEYTALKKEYDGFYQVFLDARQKLILKQRGEERLPLPSRRFLDSVFLVATMGYQASDESVSAISAALEQAETLMEYDLERRRKTEGKVPEVFDGKSFDNIINVICDRYQLPGSFRQEELANAQSYRQEKEFVAGSGLLERLCTRALEEVKLKSFTDYSVRAGA